MVVILCLSSDSDLSERLQGLQELYPLCCRLYMILRGTVMIRSPTEAGPLLVCHAGL